MAQERRSELTKIATYRKEYSGYGADQIIAFKEKVLKGLPEKIAAQKEAAEAAERKRIAATYEVKQKGGRVYVWQCFIL